MKIIYAPDYETLSRKAAQLIGAQVLYKPDSLLGLATGSSPVGAYRYLARWYASGDLDFAQLDPLIWTNIVDWMLSMSRATIIL